MPISNELIAAITERLSPGGRPCDADDAIALWQRVFGKFRPLLGPLSTDLLFARTLFIHAGEFPWLGQVSRLGGSLDTREVFGAFVDGLLDQPPEQIVAVNRALVMTYATQLADLIGECLAIRFLYAALAPVDAHKTI